MKALDRNNQIGIASMLGDQAQFIENATKATKLEIKDIEDLVTIQENKISAISELQMLVSNLRIKSIDISRVCGNNISKKVNLITDDSGKAEDYIKVTTSSAAEITDAKITVLALAKNASKIIGSTTVDGFSNSTGALLDGSLTINGSNPINISPNQTAKDIANVINASNGSVSAKVIKASTSYIEIKNKLAGLSNIVDLVWVPNNASNFGVYKEVAGADAKINIDGLDIYQSSNKFEGALTGVNIELTGKINTSDKGQDLKITLDETVILQAIDSMVEAYNKLSTFVAKHSEIVGEYDNLADPMVDQGSKAAKDAYLYNNSLVRDAKELLEVIMNQITNGSNIRSIFDIGLGLKDTLASKAQPATSIIFLDNEALFKEQLADNIDSVCKLFINSSKFVADGANKGSAILVAAVNKTITSNVTDVAVNITIDHSGQITAADVNIHGQNFSCTIETMGEFNYVVLPQESDLAGVKLYFNPNGATDTIESFIFDLYPGLTSHINQKANDIISPDGKDGTSIAEVSSIKTDITDSEKQKKSAQDELDKKIKEIETQYQTVKNTDFQAAFQMAAMESALGLNNSN